MDIVVYSGFSKRINSTKQPTGGTTKSVVLKEPTSVIRPTFIITGFDTSWNYIAWGNRYYFVDDIIILTNNQAAYNCSLDVLATYKTVIGNSSEYVVRAASASDGSIVDSLYSTKQLRTLQSQNPDGNTVTNGFVMPALGTYVFGIQGQADSSGKTFGSTTYYCMDIYNASAFMDEIFNIQNAEYDANSVESLAGIPEEVYRTIINPQQYIVSCMYLPFEYESIGSTSTSHIKLGWYDFSGSALIFDPSFDALPKTSAVFTLPRHPQNSRGAYMNGEPFTNYVLQFMPFGDIEIPADLCTGVTKVYVEAITDVLTGNSTLKVYTGDSNAGQLLLTRTAKVGVDIAITGGTYDVSLGGLAQRGVGMVAGYGILGKLGKIFDDEGFIASTQRSPDMNTQGNNGSLDFLEYPVKLYARFTHVVDDDPAQNGKPLCQIKTINTLSGYIKCINVDVDSVGTKEEKNAIISYMESGFYYE